MQISEISDLLLLGWRVLRCQHHDDLISSRGLRIQACIGQADQRTWLLRLNCARLSRTREEVHVCVIALEQIQKDRPLLCQRFRELDASARKFPTDPSDEGSTGEERIYLRTAPPRLELEEATACGKNYIVLGSRGQERVTIGAVEDL